MDLQKGEVKMSDLNITSKISILFRYKLVLAAPTFNLEPQGSTLSIKESSQKGVLLTHLDLPGVYECILGKCMFTSSVYNQICG